MMHTSDNFKGAFKAIKSLGLHLILVADAPRNLVAQSVSRESTGHKLEFAKSPVVFVLNRKLQYVLSGRHCSVCLLLRFANPSFLRWVPLRTSRFGVRSALVAASVELLN